MAIMVQSASLEAGCLFRKAEAGRQVAALILRLGGTILAHAEAARNTRTAAAGMLDGGYDGALRLESTDKAGHA